MDQQRLAFYQACVDRPGEVLFDRTGLHYDDREKAIRHLQEWQKTHPTAGLASVTDQWEAGDGEEVSHVH